jgi:predicted nucleic acid-binding protein
MPSSPVVVDASFVLRLLIPDPLNEKAEALWEAWHTPRRPIRAPSLVWFEVTNALHQYVRHGVLGEQEAEKSLRAALALGVVVDSAPEAHAVALSLARRLNLAATYDAHYLALAEILDGELWTADGRFHRAASPSVPRLRLLA